MFTIFLIGTFWFWVLLAIEFIALLAFIEHECPTMALFSIIGAGCLLQFCGDVPIVAYVVANPWVIGVGAIVYVLIGIPWGCIKWWFHLRNLREAYVDLRSEWIDTLARKIKNPESLSTEQLDAYKDVVQTGKVTKNAKKYWAKWVKDQCGYSSKFDKPGLRYNKGRIIMWMGYWPFSMLWTMINDPVRKFFRQIYHSMEGVLQRITNSVWKDIDEELGGEE